MVHLNDIADHYPEAVSFAAGRHRDEMFEADAIGDLIRVFRTYLAEVKALDDVAIRRTLIQYGPTKGIITDLIARCLRLDEGIDVASDSIVTTVGCQERICLALRALCRDSRDAVLAVASTYVGLTGAAKVLGV